MHEYKAIKSGSSVDELRRSLSHEDFERHGEPFTPEFVYEAIRQLSRFASMRVCVINSDILTPTSTNNINSVVTSRMPKSFLVSFFNRSMTNVHMW